MKFTLPTKLFLAALATLKPIAKPNTTHVIFSNVCITADKDEITLLATDSDKQLTITLPAKVKEKGATTIPISRLHDSLAKMRGEEVSIETNDKEESIVRSGSAVTKLLGLPANEMPPQISVGDGEGIDIPAGKFNKLIESALRSAHTAPEEPILSSVIMISRGGFLDFQGTNRRMAIIGTTQVAFEEDQAFIVSRDHIPAMMKIATEGDLGLLFGDNAMSVKNDTMEFRVKLLEGRVPQFEKFFEEEKSGTITCNRSELVGIVEYAEVQISEVASFVILDCDGKTIKARGSKVASAVGDEFFDMNEDSTKVKSGSAVIQVKLNPQHFREALKCFSGEEIVMQIGTDNTRPIVIQEDGIRCSICPMKLN